MHKAMKPSTPMIKMGKIEGLNQGKIKKLDSMTPMATPPKTAPSPKPSTTTEACSSHEPPPQAHPTPKPSSPTGTPTSTKPSNK